MTLLGMQARRYPSGEVEKKFSLSSFSKLAGYGLPPPLSGVGLGPVCPGFVCPAFSCSHMGHAGAWGSHSLADPASGMTLPSPAGQSFRAEAQRAALQEGVFRR